MDISTYPLGSDRVCESWAAREQLLSRKPQAFLL